MREFLYFGISYLKKKHFCKRDVPSFYKSLFLLIEISRHPLAISSEKLMTVSVLHVN